MTRSSKTTKQQLNEIFETVQNRGTHVTSLELTINYTRIDANAKLVVAIYSENMHSLLPDIFTKLESPGESRGELPPIFPLEDEIVIIDGIGVKTDEPNVDSLFPGVPGK